MPDPHGPPGPARQPPPHRLLTVSLPLRRVPTGPLSASTADRDLAAACREWIKGCSCAPAERPQDCQVCTAGFLEAVLMRARSHQLTIGSNA